MLLLIENVLIQRIHAFRGTVLNSFIKHLNLRVHDLVLFDGLENSNIHTLVHHLILIIKTKSVSPLGFMSDGPPPNTHKAE